jgi:hypothetical protein
MQNYLGTLVPGQSTSQQTDWGSKSRTQIHTSDDTGPGSDSSLVQRVVLQQIVRKDSPCDEDHEVGSQMIRARIAVDQRLAYISGKFVFLTHCSKNKFRFFLNIVLPWPN